MVKPVPVTELVKNRTPYSQRGWCAAEREWSSTRTATNLSREVDDPEGEKGGIAPMVPEAFRENVAHQLKFTHLDDVETVCRLQAEVYKAKAGMCRSLRLVDLGADALDIALSALKRYPVLESLEIVHCELSPKLPLLLKALEKIKLRQLHLQQNELLEEGTRQIFEALALQPNGTLAALSLSHDRMGVAGVKALTEAISENRTLKQLSLAKANAEITEEGTFALLEALRVSGVEAQLDLTDSDLGKAAAFALARARRAGQVQDNTITHPAVEFLCALEDKGFKLLEEERELTVAFKGLWDLFTSTAFCMALPKLPSLRVLRIVYDSCVGDARELAAGLQQHKELEVLFLWLEDFLSPAGDQYRGDEGAKALASALRELTQLKELGLCLPNNKIGPVGAMAVLESLRVLPQLADLTIALSNNAVGDEGAKALASALNELTEIKELKLDLSKGNIGPVGAMAVLESLRALPQLADLTIALSDNAVGEEEKKKLRAAFDSLPMVGEKASASALRWRVVILERFRFRAAPELVHLLGSGVLDVKVRMSEFIRSVGAELSTRAQPQATEEPQPATAPARQVRKELERVSAETFWDMVECLRGNGITEKELQGILQEVPTDSEGLLSCRKLLRRLQSRASDPGPAGLLSRAFGRCFPGRPSEPVEEKGQGTENAWAHEVCEGLRGAGNGVGEQTLQSGSSNAEVPSWSVSVSFRDEQRSLWTWTTASDSASRWTLRSDPCEGQGSSQDLQGCLLDRVHQEGHIEDCEKPMESGKLQGLDARRGSCDHSDPRTSKSAQVKEYDLADKNGLADFLVNANIQLAPQGGPGMRRISKDALHVIVRNLKGDRFTVDMLEGILQEVVPDRQGLLNCEDLAHCLRRPNPAPEPQEPKRYDLAQKQGLADFLKDADIRLVRADFILKLHREGQRLPRRQEAESAYVESRTALVTHEEVQAWADGEAPEGTQIVSKLAQTLAGNEWFFIDYVSLYQFQRFSREQNVSFGRAMQHMHVLYCHDKTSTLRIESLTPEADVIEAERRQDCVMMYHHPSGLVKPVPVTELVKNRTPYTQRGWCAAEREWSSTRTSTNLSREVDAPEGEKGGLAPMVPEIFRLSVAHQLKFTHFDDVETVCRLQAEVYKEKAETCKSLRLVDLGAEALGRALSGLERYPILEHLGTQRTAFLVVTERQLVQLHLQQSNLSEEGAFQLAQALQTNTTLAALSLARDRIGVAGVKALAEALRTNSVLTDLNLSHVCLGSDAVSTLAEALEHNQTLKQLSLAGIENAEEGAFVLLQAGLLLRMYKVQHAHYAPSPKISPTPRNPSFSSTPEPPFRTNLLCLISTRFRPFIRVAAGWIISEALPCRRSRRAVQQPSLIWATTIWARGQWQWPGTCVSERQALSWLLL
ncbi:NLRC3 [Symbiodinium sp. CCMP2592]|nr:NLRC3 [Symbiodinium sp. CCMP2592]